MSFLIYANKHIKEKNEILQGQMIMGREAWTGSSPAQAGT